MTDPGQLRAGSKATTLTTEVTARNLSLNVELEKAFKDPIQPCLYECYASERPNVHTHVALADPNQCYNHDAVALHTPMFNIYLTPQTHF